MEGTLPCFTAEKFSLINFFCTSHFLEASDVTGVRFAESILRSLPKVYNDISVLLCNMCDCLSLLVYNKGILDETQEQRKVPLKVCYAKICEEWPSHLSVLSLSQEGCWLCKCQGTLQCGILIGIWWLSGFSITEGHLHSS